MGDDSIDMVISHIDTGYLVTLPYTPPLSGLAWLQYFLGETLGGFSNKNGCQVELRSG
jgi:hypothetical protein